MIQEILSPQICAGCKGCCYFDENDRWEVPDSVTVTPKGGYLICDYLSGNGCTLGENKPPECAVYPFRIMRLGQYKVIALCKYCQPVMNLPLSRIIKFAEDRYEDFQDEFQKVNIIKEYNQEYIILKVLDL